MAAMNPVGGGDGSSVARSVPGEKEIIIDPMAILSRCWRLRLPIMIFGVLGVAAGILFSFTQRELYLGEVTLLPQSVAEGEGILGRLAQLSDAGMGPDRVEDFLYGVMLNSNRVLDPVVFREWSTGAAGDSVTLGELFELSKSPAAQSDSLSRMVKRTLRESVLRFDRDPTNGVMRVGAVVPGYPVIAADLANALVEELDAAQNQLATERAAAHRGFVEVRLKEVELKLDAAERQMSEFISNNRDYRNSPDMERRLGVMDREVSACRTVWLQLRAELEKAIVDENKKLSSVKILDSARPPFRRVFPNRMLFALVGGAIFVPVGLLGHWCFKRMRARNAHVQAS